MPAPTRRRRLLAAALGLGFVLTLYWSGALSPRPAPRYAVTDLGVLPGYAASDAAAVNSRGDVIGSATPKRPGGSWAGTGGRAYLSHGGILTDLGALPGTGGSSAQGINAQSEVTGSADFPASRHAFLYSKGRMRDLGTLPGYTDSQGAAINDTGEVAGDCTDRSAQPGSLPQHAFFYSHGKMTDLGTLPGGLRSRAWSINATGQVVGECYLRSGRVHFAPFLYDSRRKTMTALPMPPPYNWGFAFHINDRGQIGGDISGLDETTHAALWGGDRMTDLGAPPGYTSSIARGLNNRGEVVGVCFRDYNLVQTFLRDHVGGDNLLGRYLHRDTDRAFVYRAGKMQDLNELIPRDADGTRETARAINDRGQIVGQGLHHGQERAFLLTPVR